MSAPERIWIDRGPNGGWMKRFERMPDSEHEYIRKDLAQAMVAKAREEREMFAWAMEAVAKAREDALREAAAVASGCPLIIAPESVSQRAGAASVQQQVATQILALIDRTAEEEA